MAVDRLLVWLERPRMRKFLWRAFVFALALAGLGLIWVGLAPLFSPPPEPPMLPDITPATAVPTPGSPGRPSQAPAATITALHFPNPRGNPERIAVKSASGKLLVSTTLQPVRLRSDGYLVPPPGTGTWYAEPGWPKPGTLSTYHSIIAGHVSGGGKPDVFYGLINAQKGDSVTIRYDSGDVVVFRIVRVEDPGKDDVTKSPKYSWVWQSRGSTKEQVITLFTCDPNAAHVNGHSVKNIVAQAVRVG